MLGSICKTLALFQCIWWLSLYVCWANFDFSSKPFLKLCLCSLMLASRGLPVSLAYYLPVTWYAIHTLPFQLYIYNLVWLSSRSHRVCICFWNGPDIEVISSVSEIFTCTPYTRNYYWTMRFLSEGGWLFILDLTEIMKSYSYPLRVRSCFMILISFLKSFRSWRMTSAIITKLWTASLFTYLGWSDLKCKYCPEWVGSQYTILSKFKPLFIARTSKKGRLLLLSTSIVNCMVGLRLLRW
jgi:hypothetical protein